VLIVDQMPVMGKSERIEVKEYPGGHMFYSRPQSRTALKSDVMMMYA
jgi:carboxypeptidase C (cathepsin A)